MPLCPQITNTPITVIQTADFTVSSVVPLIADSTDGLANNIESIEILADGKTKVYRQAAAPTGAGINDGDLWIDTDDGNKLYVRASGVWVTAQDAAIGTAQTTANNAATAAGNAQSTATTALANAATAYSAAIASLQPSANTIVNASNQITAINGNGITVYSGASATTGARVVLNSAGLAAFNSSNVATFSLTASTGAAVFSGSVTGATITGGTLNIAGNAIIDGSGLLTATGATITGTINATAGYFGTASNGYSISSAGLTSVGTTAITGGTIQTSTGSSAVILNGASNALQFRVASAISGNIVPLGTAGILMHYGATPDTTGTTYPKVQLSFAAALLQGSASYYVQSTNSGNSALGEFRCFNTLIVDSSATFNSTMFAPNLTTSSAGVNLRVATGSIGEIQETSASSIRFKENVIGVETVFDIDPKKLLELPVRAFTYKEGYLAENDDRVGIMLPGFIAEEVDAIYPVAADYGQEGPHSWNERFIIPGMLALIQDLYKEVQTLKGE
jgi:hypothetical protein